MKRLINPICSTAVVGLLVLAGVRANATPLPIDTFFIDIPPDYSVTTEVNGSTGATKTESLGTEGVVDSGTRTGTVTVTAGTGDVKIFVGGPPVPPGVYANDTTNAAGRWTLVYDNFSGGSVDLGLTGFDRIELDNVPPSTPSPDLFFNVSLTLTDSDSADTVTISEVNGNANNTLEFFYSAFSGIDFTNVIRIELMIEGVREDGTPRINGDYGFNRFEAIPEPASVLLLGAGALLIASRRRR